MDMLALQCITMANAMEGPQIASNQCFPKHIKGADVLAINGTSHATRKNMIIAQGKILQKQFTNLKSLPMKVSTYRSK